MTEPETRRGREAILGYLRRELIGPAGGPDELIADPPHRRYIMGTIYPQETTTLELEEEEPDEVISGSLGEELPDDPVELANEWMPSSAGVTLFLRGGDALSCEVWGARYVEEPEGRSRRWRRVPLATEDAPEVHTLRAPDGRRRAEPQPVLGDRATLESFWRPLGDDLLVTVSLVNQQASDEDGSVNPERTLQQVGFRCSPSKVMSRSTPT